ncbi:hypothetical protein [Clostridium argentinense]|nr:hypothetical protein [Clostridium argentinense]NFF41169.1 hypothetical protein [Clostridium argentinense]
MSVYPGEKYNDTCINEIAFFGDNSVKSEIGAIQGSNNTQSDTISNSNIIDSKKESKSELNGEPKMYAEYYKILQERIN